jgi:predicted AAA+ superfamily ATPase
VSKLARDFQSTGLSFSRNTLFDYLALLEDAGLVHLLPTHDASVLKQARARRAEGREARWLYFSNVASYANRSRFRSLQVLLLQ